MNIELVSFPICPFGQRPLITLLKSGLPHKLTYIRPDALPEWFAATSPLGKVPLMRVGESTVLFESSVISEFVNEQAEAGMLPATPIERARARAWIEFASAVLVDLFGVVTAADEESFQRCSQGVHGKLEWLEGGLGDSALFDEGRFSLVDSAFGPLCQRLLLLDSRHPWLEWSKLSRVRDYADRLAADPAVANALPDGFEQLYTGFIVRQGGHAATLFGG